MGLFKVRAGDAATLQKPNFSQSELVHSSTPTYAASEEGPQKWADRDYTSSYKPASSASLRSVTTESASSPYQTHSPYHSSGLDANSAAGRLRQVDQFGYSRSTDQINLESKATISVDRSVSTRPVVRQYHIPYPREVSSPGSVFRSTPTSSSLAPPSINGGDTPTAIGMALGSPSHPPGSADAPWQTQTLTTVTSGGDATEPNSNPNGLSRSMSKRWNPFSRTKSKRSKPVESPASRAMGTDSGKSMDLGSRANGDVSGVDRKKGEKESDRKGAGPAARKDSSGSVSKNPIPDVPVLPNLRDAAVPTREPPVPPQLPVEQPKQLQSLLSVEIPTIEMERYSIMFGNILQKQQQQYQYFLQQAQESQPPQEPQLDPQAQPADKLQELQVVPEIQVVQEPKRPEEPRRPAPLPRPQKSLPKEPEKPQEPQESQLSPQSLQPQPQQSPRPSLPDRRQVKIDRLNLPAAKAFRDGSIPVEIVVPRRSTSPLPESSPSSLAVPDPAPAGSGPPPRLSSRRRSNTTPAAVVNFPTPAMYKVPAQSRKRTTSVSTPPHDEPLSTDAETPPERRERLISKFHRKESPSEPNMPKATDQISESPVAAPTPPQPRSILKKPTGPPPPPPTNRSAELIASPPPKQHQPQPSIASIRTEADEEEVEKALYEAVEISIARQISVSRQQRRMLVPLNRSASRRNPGEPAPDAAANIKLGKNKRLAETRTAVPVLIHPASQTSSVQGGYRKSSRVVLEGA